MSKITEISSDVQKARSEALEAARSQIDLKRQEARSTSSSAKVP